MSFRAGRNWLRLADYCIVSTHASAWSNVCLEIMCTLGAKLAQKQNLTGHTIPILTLLSLKKRTQKDLFYSQM